MARFADCNNLVTGSVNYNVNHAWLMFQLKTVLKAAGWTVSRSSDGSTYNTSGDQITLSSIGGAGGWGTSAWFVIREPGGRREWCIQFANLVSGNTAQFRVKYSANAKFTGGSPSATRVPTATDEQVLLGAGTDASPTYAAVWNLGSTNGRYHIVAESVPVNGCYPFCCFLTAPGGATQVTGIIGQEPMAVGTNSAADADPCVVYASATLAAPNGTGAFCWFGYGSGGQTWFAGPAMAASPYAGAVGVDPGNSYDVNGFPIYTGIISTILRVKGVGTTIAQKGPARTYPATCNTASDAKVYLGSYAWPFANNTVPSIA